MNEFVDIVRDGAVCELVWGSADSVTVLSAQHVMDLRQALDRALAGNPEVLILAGRGRTFCAGADLAELDAQSSESFAPWNAAIGALTTAIADVTVPVIAAINGHALGGGLEIALAADRRVVAPGARVGLPEVTLGIIPGAGGTQRLTALVGAHAARWLLMTGARLSAEEALAAGIVDELAESPLDRARQLARELTDLPTAAVVAAKQSVRHAGGDHGFRHERALIEALFDGPDRKERVARFLNTRGGTR